jgi:sugar/nucleoside kinase (ribokinase family)
MPEIVQWANLAAAMKCEVFGGVTGTPTWAQLQARAASETETPRVSTDYLKTN